MSVGRPVALAVLLLTAFSVSFLGATTGDPGGDDAPDNIQDAKLLTAPGKYSGNLTPTGDADWYKIEAADLDLVDVPVCFEAKASGSDALTHVDLTFDTEKTRVVRGELNPDVNPGLGLVTPAFKKAYSGLNPEDDNVSKGDYNLSLSVLDLDDLNGDAATGLDAPSLDSATDPIQVPDPCFGGTLDLNDTADAFSFHAEDWQKIAFTFVNATDEPVNATLVGPDGTEYGPYSTSDGDVVYEVPVDTSGGWSLELSGTTTDTSTSYLFGLSLVEDPEEEEEGCSPYC